MICNDCPRKCNIDRSALAENGKGFCGMGESAVVARAALHFWEEPPISAERGSGTVFFTGCNMKCAFCQNKEISRGGVGKKVTPERLREIYLELIEQGAHNINLVTPSHFLRPVLKSLSSPLPVPVVYNCGGYESLEALKLLDGKINIYIPDLKYADNALAKRVSKAPDYFEVATAAIKEMHRQVGDFVIDDDGVMKSGVIIRHLILPDELENTKKAIDWVSSNFKSGEVMFSLMSQFTPNGDCRGGQFSRRLTQEEYDETAEYLYCSGIEDGFMQELSSAKEEYTPPFDLTGV